MLKAQCISFQMLLLLLIYAVFHCLSVAPVIRQGPISATISLPIDHFNVSDSRTFLNRYWMNDTYYSKGGPIFFYDNGEAGVSDSQASRTLSAELVFAPLELARKYHGIAIVWEHRFYGSSLPFPVNETTGHALDGYDAYKYLTIEQALEDAVYFATHFSPPGCTEDESISLRSNSTPWIWMGGSYPGIRAAIIRQRNPDVFFASWASSASVETSVDGSVYYNNIRTHSNAKELFC